MKLCRKYASTTSWVAVNQQKTIKVGQKNKGAIPDSFGLDFQKEKGGRMLYKAIYHKTLKSCHIFHQIFSSSNVSTLNIIFGNVLSRIISNLISTLYKRELRELT
jgi:hypothetical protein